MENETKQILRGAVNEHVKNLRSRPFNVLHMLPACWCCCMMHVDVVSLVVW